VVTSCANYSAKEQLDSSAYARLLKHVAPYVIKKPDEFAYDERFKAENWPFYDHFIELTQGEISLYHRNDSASFFFFEHKDLTSLYEHYRGLGGYFKSDASGNITFLNLLYHTPRLTRVEMDKRRLELFSEMVRKGHIQRYLGNRKYVHTPNQDFYYNTKTNRWDYTKNSSWKFLEEAREQADSLVAN
jgi:hypothetical protein